MKHVIGYVIGYIICLTIIFIMMAISPILYKWFVFVFYGISILGLTIMIFQKMDNKKHVDVVNVFPILHVFIFKYLGFSIEIQIVHAIFVIVYYLLLGIKTYKYNKK
jgi:hypothetical protein